MPTTGREVDAVRVVGQTDAVNDAEDLSTTGIVDDAATENIELTGGAGTGSRLEYELDDWAVESRQMLRQLLIGEGIPHVWEAGRLVIPEQFEERADACVDQVAATFAGSLDDPETPRVVFDVADFDDELVNELTAALDNLAVEWFLDTDGGLVVRSTDSVTVDGVLEALEFPDALESSNDDEVDDETDIPEVDPDRVLGGLFVAADRLSRNATDPDGVLDTIRLSEELQEGAMPFGFETVVWERLVTATVELAGQLGGTESSDDDVEASATRLRDLLRHWV